MCDWLEAQVAHGSLSLTRGLLKLLSALLFKHVQPESVRHIVVYRVGNIGDTVVAIPALTALRQVFPQAVITLLTSAGQSELPGAALILESFPGLVDRIVTYLPPEIKTRRGLSRLRSEIGQSGRVDLFVDLPVTMQTLRRGLQELFLARFLGARSAFGFELLLPAVFRSAYSRRFAARLPRTVDWLEAIVRRNLGLTAQSVNPLAYFQQYNQPDWSQLGLNPGLSMLAVNAGAKLAIKRWPAEAFRESILKLREQVPGLQVALLGSAGEWELNQDIAAGFSGVVNLAGKLTLNETWALISAATAVLSNDTGTMHMAGLLKKPVFSPMSGQYPAPLWHPPGDTFTVFRHPVSCAPCLKDSCPLPEQICLSRIEPSKVSQAVFGVLKSPQGLLYARE